MKLLRLLVQGCHALLRVEANLAHYEDKTMFVDSIWMNNNRAVAPWQGLGVDVEAGDSLTDIQAKAGLDWKVNRRYVRMKVNPESEEEMIIPGYMAIVRDTDNRVYQVATDRYKPIQNSTIVQFFKEYCESGGMTMKTAGSLKGGSIVWALAGINESFTLGNGDKVEGNLLLANSHDGSLSFVAKFTSVCVVCYNTLMAALKGEGNQFRMRHSKKFDSKTQQDAKEKLGLAVKQLSALKETSQMLTEAKVDRNGYVVKEFILRLTNPDLLNEVVAANDAASRVPVGGSVLDAIIAEHSVMQKAKRTITDDDLGRAGRGVLNSIMNSPGSELDSRKNTWWGVLNGVTHYADHVAGRDRDTALYSSWFGQKEQMKEQALNLAVNYATAKVN